MLNFTVNTSSAVKVLGPGTPMLALTIGGIGGNTPYASYVSGSGSTALLFSYKVQGGDTANSGISTASMLSLNGGSILDAKALALVPSFTALTSNGVVVDTTAPALSAVTVNGNQLVISYAETGSGLNASDVPLASAFKVINNTQSAEVTGLKFDATNKTVTLTLSKAVVNSDMVTVAYTPDGIPSQALQDKAGNLVANLAATTVTNTTPSTASSIISVTGPLSLIHI